MRRGSGAPRAWKEQKTIADLRLKGTGEERRSQKPTGRVGEFRSGERPHKLRGFSAAACGEQSFSQ